MSIGSRLDRIEKALAEIPIPASPPEAPTGPDPAHLFAALCEARFNREPEPPGIPDDIRAEVECYWPAISELYQGKLGAPPGEDRKE